MKFFQFLFSLCCLIALPSWTAAQLDEIPLDSNFQYRNIGPANQGGRIVDIAAKADDFTQAYIATASGGVWKTQNAGTTWTPIFDDYNTASIGDIAIDPNDFNNIWVGTGEANNRNSVSWGNGIYKSTDGGETFINKGLESTHQIARVLVNPEATDELCVCAIGHLWGYSGDRGLFMTKNGGDSWDKLTNGLPNDGKTGCTDLVRDSKNPDILYAAFYHRLRQPWHFQSGGEKGGIYKSIDGGKSWTQLTNGLPSPTGRIGLAIYEKNPNILMAIVEAEKSDTLSTLGSGVYRSEDAGATWQYVNTYNNRPFYYSQIRINPSDDQRVYVLTTRFMVSEDGGNTFINGSKDQEVHGDFHAMWLDPKHPDRYYLGADKGLSITHDHGKNFQLIDNLPIAQFYRINYDWREPYYVYGGLQDNGSYATASFSRDARGILNDSNWKMHWGDGQDAAINPDDYTDMYTSMENGSFFKYNPETRRIKRISPNAFNTLNHWEYFDKNETDRVSANRFNWSAPLVMSTHDPHTIYVGGNHLYVTKDQGATWKIISPDLSTKDPIKAKEGESGGITPDNTGAETHCAITGIAPSTIDPNLFWVCTDDGNIQLTKNGGQSWVNLRSHISEVPTGLWASRIIASKFNKAVAYVSFDGHRSDHFGTYIYKTKDYGNTWQKITNGFTQGETVRVIREDVKNENLLFAGTETGVWISLNQGKSWSRLKLNMPTVSVYDLKIHPRENDLIVGSHGRSLWILNDISPLQELAGKNIKEPIYIPTQKTATLWENRSRGGQRGHFWFAGDNPKTIKNTSSVPRANYRSNVALSFYVSPTIKDSLTLTITNLKGDLEKTIRIAPQAGVNRIYWNREFEGEEFTPTQLKQLEIILQNIADEINNSRVRRILAKFKTLDSADEIRRLIAPLTGGYLSYEFDPQFLIPTAGEGNYLFSLKAGGVEKVGSFVIRKDPMLE